MNKAFTRLVFSLLLVAYVTTHFLARAHAQSSLGIGTSDAITPSSGLFGELMQWVNTHQQAFYRSLTGALKAMREDGSKLWVLIGLSFAYGVFHAAGPGHGKAVISSYMLANEVALRRGVVLSFVSAFLQAIVAIVLMGAVFLVLRGTSIRMTDAAWFLEIVSYAAIAAFGAWLLWSKLAPRLRGRIGSAPAYSLSSAGSATADLFGEHRPVRVRAGSAFRAEAIDPATHRHAPGEVCATCGHSHAPDPSLLTGDRFNWRSAWAAMAAVGLRPCSGALIVLTFAFLNGLWLGGILSVFAMAVGTGITVALLATLAVTAKNWAVAMAGDGRIGNAVHATIEIGGAAMVLVLGLVLLTASLSE